MHQVSDKRCFKFSVSAERDHQPGVEILREEAVEGRCLFLEFRCQRKRGYILQQRVQEESRMWKSWCRTADSNTRVRRRRRKGCVGVQTWHSSGSSLPREWSPHTRIGTRTLTSCPWHSATPASHIMVITLGSQPRPLGPGKKYYSLTLLFPLIRLPYRARVMWF